MDTVRDELAIFNERRKLFANFVNALGLGLLGLSVLKPMVENPSIIPETDHSVLCDMNEPNLVATAFWILIGLALHLFSRYILGGLRKEA